MLNVKKQYAAIIILLSYFLPAFSMDDALLTPRARAAAQGQQAAQRKTWGHPLIVQRLKAGFEEQGENCTQDDSNRYAAALEIMCGTNDLIMPAERTHYNERALVPLLKDLANIVYSYCDPFEPYKTLEIPGLIAGLALFDQGDTLAIGCNKEAVYACRWRASNPEDAVKKISTGHNDLYSIVAVSSNEFTVNTDETVDYLDRANQISQKNVWNIRTGKHVGAFPPELSQDEIASLCASSRLTDDSYFSAISASPDDIITIASTWDILKQYDRHKAQWKEINAPGTQAGSYRTFETTILGKMICYTQNRSYDKSILLYDIATKKCALPFNYTLHSVNKCDTGWYPTIKSSCISPTGAIIALMEVDTKVFAMQFNPKTHTISYLTSCGWKKLCQAPFYDRKNPEPGKAYKPIIPAEDFEKTMRIEVDLKSNYPIVCALIPNRDVLAIAVTQYDAKQARDIGRVVILRHPCFTQTVAEPPSNDAPIASVADNSHSNDDEPNDKEEHEALTEDDESSIRLPPTPIMTTRTALMYSACAGIGLMGFYTLWTKYRQSCRA